MNRPRASRKSFADQKLAVDQFGTDLRIVRERIDENTVRITGLSQEVEALRLAIPQFQTPAPVRRCLSIRTRRRRRPERPRPRCRPLPGRP